MKQETIKQETMKQEAMKQEMRGWNNKFTFVEAKNPLAAVAVRGFLEKKQWFNSDTFKNIILWKRKK